MLNNTLSNGHAEIIEWAKKALNQPELSSSVVVEAPWSSVLRINTLERTLYLKQTPPDLFIEVDIINKCRQLCKITSIPEVIAANGDLHCFLMEECGDVSLRTLFDGHLEIDLLIQGLHVYKEIQQATAPYLNAFLQSGVPDWRLEKFPKLYQGLVRDETFLQVHGLEMAQIRTLQGATKYIETLCQDFSTYGIPECLDHSDFHDNNMIYSKVTKGICIVDLGETSITHPFFSLAACIKATSDRYQLETGSSDYQKLYDTCFEGCLSTTKDLKKANWITQQLLPIYFIFAEMRLINATNPEALEKIERRKNRLKEAYLWFIKNLRGKGSNLDK